MKKVVLVPAIKRLVVYHKVCRFSCLLSALMHIDTESRDKSTCSANDNNSQGQQDELGTSTNFLFVATSRYGRPVPGVGGGNSHIKRGGMLVVSLRGVNFVFWSHLGCFGQNTIICSCEGLL